MLENRYHADIFLNITGNERRGTAAAEQFRPPEIFYGGLVVAGIGAVVAVFSEIPVRLDVGPHGAQVSKSFGF